MPPANFVKAVLPKEATKNQDTSVEVTVVDTDKQGFTAESHRLLGLAILTEEHVKINTQEALMVQ